MERGFITTVSVAAGATIGYITKNKVGAAVGAIMGAGLAARRIGQGTSLLLGSMTAAGMAVNATIVAISLYELYKDTQVDQLGDILGDDDEDNAASGSTGSQPDKKTN